MTNLERIQAMSWEDMEDTINQIAEMGEYMGEYIPFSDTPTAKACWVLMYANF